MKAGNRYERSGKAGCDSAYLRILLVVDIVQQASALHIQIYRRVLAQAQCCRGTMAADLTMDHIVNGLCLMDRWNDADVMGSTHQHGNR